MHVHFFVSLNKLLFSHSLKYLGIVLLFIMYHVVCHKIYGGSSDKSDNRYRGGTIISFGVIFILCTRNARIGRPAIALLRTLVLKLPLVTGDS